MNNVTKTEKKGLPKEVEGVLFIIGASVIFGGIANVMSVSHMLNTIMSTAHDLLSQNFSLRKGLRIVL